MACTAAQFSSMVATPNTHAHAHAHAQAHAHAHTPPPHACGPIVAPMHCAPTEFGAFFVAIPDCVLGGMTTFLFANVGVTGIK